MGIRGCGGKRLMRSGGSSVRPAGLRPRLVRILARTDRGACRRDQPGRGRGEQRRAARGEPSGTGQVRVERHGQRVGEQLAPGRVAAAAAAEPDRGRGTAEGTQVFELAAEQERDPLQGGAQQVVPLVGQGQAGPGTPRGAVVPALAGQVGQEDGRVRSPGAVGGVVQLVPAGAQRPPRPVQRHADVLRRGQPIGPAVYGPEQVDGAALRIRIIRKWNIGVRRGGDDELAAGAQGEQAPMGGRQARGRQARGRQARGRARGREVRGQQGSRGVGGADRDREAGAQAQVSGGGGQQRPGDLGG